MQMQSEKTSAEVDSFILDYFVPRNDLPHICLYLFCSATCFILHMLFDCRRHLHYVEQPQL